MKPLSPSNVGRAKAAAVPPFVIEIFNKLIAREWGGHSATVKQTDVANMIVEHLGAELHENPLCRRAVVFERHYLDVEDAFRAEGWAVTYHKGAYFETWEPYFIFTKGRKLKDKL
jgi:hypothetical protein